MELRLAHAFVHVANLQTMLDFYTGMLGFEVTDRGLIDGRPVAFLSQVASEHHQLAFLQHGVDAAAAGDGETAASAMPGSTGHFAFRVEALAEVRELHDRLKADGRVRGLRPMTHGNAWAVYFADPEGNGIEVFCDTPWHVSQPQGATWDPSLGDDAVRSATERRFRDAPGFGPIDAFYRDRAEHLSRRRNASGG